MNCHLPKITLLLAVTSAMFACSSGGSAGSSSGSGGGSSSNLVFANSVGLMYESNNVLGNSSQPLGLPNAAYNLTTDGSGNLYACVNNSFGSVSVWKLPVGSLLWQRVGNTYVPNSLNEISSLAVSESGDVYVGIQDYKYGYVYQLQNESWVKLGNTHIPNSNSAPIVITVDNAGNLYADVFNGVSHYVYRFQNSIWALVGNTAIPNSSVYTSAINTDNSDNVYVSATDHDTGSSVYKLENDNWVRLGGRHEFDSSIISNLATDGTGDVYANATNVINNNDSVDEFNIQTESWSVLGNGAYVPVGFLDLNTSLSVTNSGDVYIGTHDGVNSHEYVYKMENESWTLLGGAHIPDSNDIVEQNSGNFIVARESNVYAAANTSGYVYTLQAESWDILGNGSLPDSTIGITSIATDSSGHIYAGTNTDHHSYVYELQDESWVMLGNASVPNSDPDDGSALNFIEIAVSNNGNVYAGVTESASGNVYTLQSESWVLVGGESVPNSSQGIASVATDESANHLYVAAANSAAYVYTLQNESWVLVGGASVPHSAHTELGSYNNNMVIDNAGNLYISVFDDSHSFVYQLVNESWALVGGGYLPNNVTSSSIAVNDNGVLYATANDEFGQGYVYKVENGSWFLVGGGSLPDGSWVETVQIINDSVYVGSLNGNIYVSTKDGAWQNINYGNGAPIIEMAILKS